MNGRDIVVIGASAGGFEAIERLVSDLPEDHPAAIFITLRCPECVGVMTLARMDNLREFCCHTGHRFGLSSMILQKAMAVENALNNALAQSEEMNALLEGSLSMSPPENAPDICDEIAELRNEQEMIRRLTSRRGEQTELE